MTIVVPSQGVESWRRLLADPEKHWAKGYSARTLAHCWEDTSGFPREVAQLLAQHPTLRSAIPLLILPEWKVALPGRGRASQNDVWVLARADAGLVSLAIEGKVNEPFASTVGEWLAGASDGRKQRLEALRSLLGLRAPIPDHIRYQLIHRAASAVIEAQRFGALHAVMLVHSFSPTNRWFDDFAEFCALFELTAAIDTIASTTTVSGIELHLGWVHGDERYLEAETERENRLLVDEINRRVGRNLLMFQAAEESLRFVLPYVHPDGSKQGAEPMRVYAEGSVSDRTLGPLIEQFKQAAKTDDKQLLAQDLMAFVDARNELVHHFYRNPAFDLTAANGATAALAYLDEQFRRAREWGNIFRDYAAAVLLALMEKNPKLAAELAPHRERLLAQAPRTPDS